TLDLDRCRRGGGAGELRVEDGSDPIRALRRERRSRIEQAEIAGMGEMDDAMLHLRDHPGEKLLERLRRGEIEAKQLLANGWYIERRRGRAGDAPRVRRS